MFERAQAELKAAVEKRDELRKALEADLQAIATAGTWRMSRSSEC